MLCLALVALSALAALCMAETITPQHLSPEARYIYNRVIKMAKEADSPIPKRLILTSGRFRKQLAQYGDRTSFVDSLFFEELVSAQEEVLISTFIFAKNLAPTPLGVRDAVLELEKRAAARKKKVRFYLAFDPLGTAFFQGSMLPVENFVVTRAYKRRITSINLPDPSSLKWVDFKVLKYHSGLLGALHSKMMLIDGKTTIMGSKNMDGDTCMEFMFVMDGQLTRSMRADFAEIWGEPIPDLTTPAPEFDPTKDVPVLVVSRPQNAESWEANINVPQDQAWLTALEVAQDHVYIQSPNFCDKHIANAVMLAIVKSAITVTIVTSFRQGDSPQRKYSNGYGSNGETMNVMYAQLQKYGPDIPERLRWCWFIGKQAGPNPTPKQEEWSHVKFMSVDDKFAIVGSGNQDPQSWYHSRENNVLIDSPEVTVGMKKTLLAQQQSLNYCYSGAPGEKRHV